MNRKEEILVCSIYERKKGGEKRLLLYATYTKGKNKEWVERKRFYVCSIYERKKERVLVCAK